MKNHYVLTPGEFFTAREILKHRKDLELCFPIADRGWDLLAIKKDKRASVRIQVKESRVYSNGNSWHQIKMAKLAETDIFVVIYTPTVAGARTGFTEDFLVIPRKRLEQQCASKKCSKGKFSFYFAENGGEWTERRERRVNVSEFHGAWHLI